MADGECQVAKAVIDGLEWDRTVSEDQTGSAAGAAEAGQAEDSRPQLTEVPHPATE